MFFTQTRNINNEFADRRCAAGPWDQEEAQADSGEVLTGFQLQDSPCTGTQFRYKYWCGAATVPHLHHRRRLAAVAEIAVLNGRHESPERDQGKVSSCCLIIIVSAED